MIPKGNQRGGGQQLATHLLNAFDNERVEIADIRGTVARDLHGALKEWRAISKATRCKKYLYSLSVNPDHRQGPVTRAQYFDFIERAEKALGLSGQARAVVFHVKNGREHCHVVWSRIDVDRLRAVHIAHDRQKLRLVARAFARDHGLELPAGMKKDRSTERFNEQAKCSNLAERQQQERTGITKEERRKAITEAWQHSSSGYEFVRALAQRGYYLARGDKRAYVVIDLAGEIHSLSRQLTGVKAREIKALLADYPVEKIPGVEAAREHARQQREQRRTPDREPFRERADARRAQLAQDQSRRRTVLAAKRDRLSQRQTAERASMAARHKTLEAAVSENRRQRAAKGLAASLGKLSGIHALVALYHRWQDRKRAAGYAAERAALARQHERQQQEFRRHIRALARVEKRERRSLQTALHREEFQLIARQREAVREKVVKQPERAIPLTEIFRSRAGEGAQEKDHAADGRGSGQSGRSTIADRFNERAAQPDRPERDLRDRFNDAAATPPVPAPQPLRETFDRAAKDAPARDTADDELLDAIRKRAAREHERQRRQRDRGRGR